MGLLPARPGRAHLAATALVVLLASHRPAAAAVGAEDPLPVDREVVRGALPNGVRYLIAPNHETSDAAAWMNLDVGSLHEDTGEEGLAHFVEHMAFRGTEHYLHDSVTRRLEALGLAVGTDQNAVTTLRRTIYKLNLPTGDAGALAEGLKVLADFGFRRTPSEVDVVRERPVVLAELRASDTPANRVDDELFATIFAGTKTARHLPLGRARVIENVTRASIDSFVTRWYRPERATVIVTGNVDPQAALTLIEREFGAFEAATPRPVEPSPLAGASHPVHTLVITDPEQTNAQVRIIGVEPLGPIATVGDLEAEVARRVAMRLVDQRLRDDVDFRAPFADALAETVPSLGGAVREMMVQGTAPASDWPRVVKTLAGALEDMTRSGFTAAELEEARSSILSDARSRAALAATRPAAHVAAELSDAVSAGELPLSAADRLSLLEELLPRIDDEEVRSLLGQTFSPEHRLLALILPSRGSVRPPTPGRVELLARRPAVAEARRAPAAAAAAFPVDPDPGAVLEESTDPRSGTTSLALANGVLVHIRPMTERRDEVRVQITLAGGELLETASTRGLSEAAATAFDVPASDGLSAPSLRSALAGRDIDLSGCACDGDALTAELVTGRADLEMGMRLLHLVLERGRVTPAALERWKAGALEGAATEAHDPEVRVGDELPAAIAGLDPRVRPLTPAQIARVDVASAQAWLDRHRMTAPMEVAMVGDADRVELVRLARKYLGSLPGRPRRDARLEALRRPAPTAPAPLRLVVDAVSARAAIAVALPLPERPSTSEADALELGRVILADRLRDALREQRGLTYGVSLDAQATSGLRGATALVVTLSTDSRRVGEAAQLVRRIVARMATAAPSADELAAAKARTVARLVAEARRPSVWADALARWSYRGADLERLTQTGRGGAVGPEAVRLAFERLGANKGSITMIAMPRPTFVLRSRARR